MGVVQRPVTAAESRRGADGLVVLPPEVPLPALPSFSINMYLPKTGGSDIGRELARHIREQFYARHHRVA